MANDRLIIVCEWCGTWTTAAKYYPSHDLLEHPKETRRLAEFINLHRECNPNWQDLGDEPLFSILTEGGIIARGADLSAAWKGGIRKVRPLNSEKV